MTPIKLLKFDLTQMLLNNNIKTSILFFIYIIDLMCQQCVMDFHETVLTVYIYQLLRPLIAL